MITKRQSNERGHADHGWLDTRHTFSFADYNDPRFAGFRSVRVINEDWIGPGGGFGMHPHHDMEILTYPIRGALAHRDSMGNGAQVGAGEIQRMTAGTGVRHSEHNASADDTVHLLQIWIFPEARGLKPDYEQKRLPTLPNGRTDGLQEIASRAGSEHGVRLNQDATLLRGILGPGEVARHELGVDRHAWVQVIEGGARLNNVELAAGDGAAVSDLSALELEAGKDGAHLLVFDLA